MAFEVSLNSSELLRYVEMGGSARQEKQAWEGILEVRTGRREMPKQRTYPETAGT